MLGTLRTSVYRIVLASVLAPLAIAVPIVLVVVILGSSPAYLVSGSSSHGIGSPFGFGVAFALPVYLLLLASILATTILLRSLRALTRRNLFTLATIAAILVSATISCDWSGVCEPSAFFANFFLYSFILGIASVILVLAWWWVASKMAPPA